MNSIFDQKDGARMGKVLMFLGLMLALFVTMLFIKEAQSLGVPGDVSQAATIDVSGTGETFAIPNIANESFSVQQQAATVADAQATVTKKANAAIAFLKDSGIDAKDIQTTDYSANPQYESPVSCMNGLCPNTPPKITGYIVSETVSIKIRDTSKVGAIVDGLGKQGVTGLNGPNFAIDDMDAVNAAARANAIKDAEQKADVLAKQLGVRLVRIVRFSESGSNYPMAYATKSIGMDVGAPQAPTIEPGQNKYTSNVTVTYEIR